VTDIRTLIRVDRDRRISGIAPAAVPAGEHEATITVSRSRQVKRARIADLPTHDLPWDGSIPLRREDIYGNDGR
jgi:hypothetical protein